MRVRVVKSKSQSEGKIFEELFKQQAQYLGLLPIKQHLSARMLHGGRVKVTKSDLDFRLITREGRVGFFDCKSYGKDSFSYSQIDENQLNLANLYHEWGVPSGFVVWFRPANRVTFFSGPAIVSKGPQSSFGPEDGQYIGRFERFDLRLVMGEK